jgi:Domain of unknown function (DUF4282)
VPPQGWGPEQRPESKGLIARLLDTSFDDLITSSVIRAAYRLALVVTTLWTLFILLVGLWLFQYGWLLTIMAFIAAPLIWLSTMLGARLFLEAIIVHFKGVEYLRVMKDRDGAH